MRSILVGGAGGGLEDVRASVHLGWPRSQVTAVPPDLACGATLRESAPDLIIVQVASRRVDSFSLVRALREWYAGVIVVVSRYESEATVIEALDVGADDCFTLPLNRSLFVARTRAALRRAGADREAPSPGVLRFGDLVIDEDRHEARVDGRVLDLTCMEFKLVVHLAMRGEMVARKEALCESMWGRHGVCEDAALRKHIQLVRRKLRHAASEALSIETVPGVGYRLVNGGVGLRGISSSHFLHSTLA